MTQHYQLLQDRENNEWQLLRQGAANIESIFVSLDDAIRKLPDAVGFDETVVTIFDSQGLRLGEHIVERATMLLGPMLV